MFHLLFQQRVDNLSSPPYIVEVRDDSSSLPPKKITSPSVDIRHQDKGKGVVVGEEERTAPKRCLEEKDVSADFGGVKKSQMAPLQDLIPNSSDWVEHINNMFCQDELDPAILEKLPPPSTMATASVHRYWTSVWAGSAEGVDLLKLIKMAEINTVQSHIFNYKLYEVFTIKADELPSKVAGVEDIDALCSENKALHTRLSISKEARARATY
ncbi:hypothetical protein Adt_18693 [Abeliophyllum distichum]|uniref:Uncharacterized protein n=1 Tax=Abeliophyllum distichum TaxID=126358 RepID=A0ABD1TKK7_9LAMI